MELEILKLVYDYSAKGKLVDSKYIEKIIEIVVSKRSIHDYVKSLQFTNELGKDDNGVACAAYNPFDGRIIIDTESIKFIMERMEYYDQLFLDFEQIMFRNLTISQFVLHELEHAYQNKQADSKDDNSIEAKLAKASFFLERAMKNPKFATLVTSGEISEKEFIIYFLQNREQYKEYYKLNPIERLAQVNSFNTLVSTIEPIQQHIPNLYEFKKASLIEEMLKGYPEAWDMGVCPTQVYLYGTRQQQVWQELSKTIDAGNFDLGKRLTLGLSIDFDEYDTTDSWLKSTNKFNH